MQHVEGHSKMPYRC